MNATALLRRSYSIWKDGLLFDTNTTALESQVCNKACKSQNAQLLSSTLEAIINWEQMIIFLFVGAILGYGIWLIRDGFRHYPANFNLRDLRPYSPPNQGRSSSNSQPLRNRRTFPHFAPVPEVETISNDRNTRTDPESWLSWRAFFDGGEGPQSRY